MLKYVFICKNMNFRGLVITIENEMIILTEVGLIELIDGLEHFQLETYELLSELN